MTGSLAALTTGCFGHVVPAEASFAGLDVPVMLGPKDRVGGTDKRLATTKVNEFEATSKHLMANSQSGGYSYSVDMSESSVLPEARDATRKYRAGEVDIRLTEVKPQSVGVITSIKARVDIRGDVVQVGGVQ